MHPQPPKGLPIPFKGHWEPHFQGAPQVFCNQPTFKGFPPARVVPVTGEDGGCIQKPCQPIKPEDTIGGKLNIIA